jgi:hypothetical protein
MVGNDWTLATPTPGTASFNAVALAPHSQLSINEWVSNRVPGQSDWLELYNRDESSPVALRDLNLKSGDTTFRYRALSFLVPGGFLRLWADEMAGPAHLDFRLQAEGGTLSLLDSNGVAFEALNYSSQSEDVSSGRWPDGAASIVTFTNAASPGAANYQSNNPGLLFNELQAEFAGTGPGWIELKNTSGTLFSLTGHSLTLGHRDGTRWPFPSGQSIPGNGHLVVLCDGLRAPASLPGDMNTGIALSPIGQELYLFDAAGHEIDRLRYGSQVAGQSIGRPADLGTWTLLSSPTQGTGNPGAAPLGLVTSLRINEWLANAGLNESDYVELFNTSALQSISLAGLRLTDDLTTNGINQFAIPALSFIGPSSFALFIADGSPEIGHLPFSLDADGETLRLYRSTGSTILNEVTWGIETEGVSSGRLPDGAATLGTLAFQSPGISNQSNPNLDSDGDEMLDSWELAHGLNPNNPADAALDADEDERSNLYEFRSGTNPNDPSSFLAISSTSRDTNGFRIEFTAHAGIRYTVEHSENLVDWQQLEVIESQSVDRLESVLASAPGARHFYRLAAERAP